MTELTKPKKKQAGDSPTAEEPMQFRPPADIFENDQRVRVRCDMPGVSEKQIEITLENGVLTLSGRQDDFAPAGYDRVLREYETGIYRRTFTLSDVIDVDGIKARLSNGILEVELPKVKQAQPRKIRVEVG